jgi:hypothetical protein
MKTPTRVVRRGEKGLFGFRLLLFCLLAAVLLAGCADTNAPVSPVAPVVSSWAFVDGTGADGINRQAFFYADLPQLTVFEGRLYATWQESNGTALQVRVAVYSGDDASPVWAFVDGNGTNGINKDASQGGVPTATDRLWRQALCHLG